MKSLFIKWVVGLVALIGVTACSVEEKVAVQDVEEGALWIDVRTKGELASGMLSQAVHIPHEEVAGKIAELTADKEQVIYLYCRSGNRAGKVLTALEQMGYSRVENLGGYSDVKHLDVKGS